LCWPVDPSAGPRSPLYSGAFGLSFVKDCRRLYARIPENTDVLITHGPPFGILDFDPQTGSHEGCHELLETVMGVRPKLHVFGHIHAAHGVFQKEHTTFVNASRPGLPRDPDKGPFTFRMSRALKAGWSLAEQRNRDVAKLK
jgi:hypothetical protein